MPIEKNYKAFVADIKREKPTITAVYYKKIIAKGILFNAIDGIVKAQNLGGYKANMNAYLMAAISFLSDGNLDLTYIWENQKVQDEVLAKVEALVPLVWNHITGSATGNQSSNVGEWTKKNDCWNKLKYSSPQEPPYHSHPLRLLLASGLFRYMLRL